MNPIIVSNWQLVYKHDGSPVHEGDRVATTKRDEVVIIRGGRPPHHSGSTGRVEIQHTDDNRTAEYFPQCFDLEWQQRGAGCDETAHFRCEG